MSIPDRAPFSSPSPNQPPEQAPEDRRRLHRDIPYKKVQRGFYTTADYMHGIQRVGHDTWERGVRQPYHLDGQFDFTKAEHFRRLRDAQTHVEGEERNLPRTKQQRTWFNDRRGI